MLTAQARYQDPLEPVDSSEYAAQLAQFSMVEQQVLSNDLLSALGNQIGSGEIAQMASWIGMEARTTAPIAFDGVPIEIQPKIESGADEAVLVVYDVARNEIQRQQISTSAGIFEWAGVGNDGTPVPAGVYSFEVESLKQGQLQSTASAETYSRITEVRRVGDSSVLVLTGGSTILPAEVAALREAA